MNQAVTMEAKAKNVMVVIFRGVPIWVFLLKPMSDIYYVKSCQYRLLIRYSKFIVYALKVTENSI